MAENVKIKLIVKYYMNIKRAVKCKTLGEKP